MAALAPPPPPTCWPQYHQSLLSRNVISSPTRKTPSCFPSGSSMLKPLASLVNTLQLHLSVSIKDGTLRKKGHQKNRMSKIIMLLYILEHLQKGISTPSETQEWPLAQSASSRQPTLKSNNATSQPCDRTCNTYLTILAKVIPAVALSRAAVHSVVIVRVVWVLVGREVRLKIR